MIILIVIMVAMGEIIVAILITLTVIEVVTEEIVFVDVITLIIVEVMEALILDEVENNLSSMRQIV